MPLKSIRDLRAKKGERILPKWQALLEYIASTRIVVGEGMKVSQTPDGTVVTADIPFRPFPHPFRCTVSGGQLEVRPGTVNGVTPYMDELPLDGRDKDGNKVDFPRLEVEYPNAQKSYVVVVVRVDGEGNVKAIQDNEGSVTIEHTADLDPSIFLEGGSDDVRGVGIHPIAQLTWDRKTRQLEGLFQMTHHNLGHRYTASDPLSGAFSKHFFWAV